jgi:predicted esterase
MAVAMTAIAGVKPPLVVMPKGSEGADTLPVAVWLHGYGADPTKIITEPVYQATADRLHIVIVGVYATNDMQHDSYKWSELPTMDYDQVEESLKTVEREKHIHFSRKLLFGFSQGACVAAELSVRYPQEFSGAIILSPGGDTRPGPIPTRQGNEKQTFYLSCGAEEAPGNVLYTRAYAKYLSNIGATVHAREVPGMKDHTRPPDWPDRLPEWITDKLKPK